MWVCMYMCEYVNVCVLLHIRAAGSLKSTYAFFYTYVLFVYYKNYCVFFTCSLSLSVVLGSFLATEFSFDHLQHLRALFEVRRY